MKWHSVRFVPGAMMTGNVRRRQSRHRHFEEAGLVPPRFWVVLAWVAAAVVLLLAVVIAVQNKTEGSPTAPSVSGTAPFPLDAPPGFGPSQLRFEDMFRTSPLDRSKWAPFIASRGSNGLAWNGNNKRGSALGKPSSRSMLDYNLPSQLRVHQGLSLTAVRRRTVGMLGTRPTVFPWRSGIVSTYQKFEFKGGYVQVEAKVPTEPGMWPAIWMLPGASTTSGDDYELDIFEGGFTLKDASSRDTYAWHLITPSGTVGGVTNTHEDLGAQFHVYGMRWVPKKSITWYLDGHVVGEVTRAQVSIPSEPMDLIIDLGVAAASTESFRSVTNSSTPVASRMVVREVQVYSGSNASR
jgi:hypothetical protein